MPDSGNSQIRLFELLFTRKRQIFVSLAAGIVRDTAVAEDIVSDTFSYVWENRNRLSIEDYCNYLFIAVKTNALDYRRKTNRHKEIYDNIVKREQGLMDYYSQAIESCNPSGLYEKEILRIVREELEKLPKVNRDVFIKKKLEGKSYKEISEETGLSTSSIDNKLRSVMKVLNEALKDYRELMIILVSVMDMTL